MELNEWDNGLLTCICRTWTAFKNPARNDDLILHHWVRGTHQDDEEYPFAKLNQKIRVPNFDENDYKEAFSDPNWTYNETNYLFELCRDYDLRWIVIHDRYEYKDEKNTDSDTKEKSDGDNNNDKMDVDEDEDESSENDKTKDKIDSDKEAQSVENGETPNDTATSSNTKKKTDDLSSSRSIEDLKDRFYTVCRSLLKLQQSRSGTALTTAEEDLYKQMKFSKDNEIKRKAHLERLLSRSPAEVAEEEALVIESRKLEAAAERMLSERADLLRLLDAPQASGSIAQYQASQGLAQLTSTLLTSDKTRKRKDATSSPTAESGALSPVAVTSAGIDAAVPNTPSVPGAAKSSKGTDDSKTTPKTSVKTEKTDKNEKGEKGEKVDKLDKPEKGDKPGKSEKGEKAEKGVKGVKGVKGEKGGGKDENPDKVEKHKKTGTKESSSSNNGSLVAQVIQKKLSAKEEAAYGISYQDKPSTGVYLRSTKITTLKSNAQSKIIAALNELNIPARPTMPTAKVSAKFDSLQQSISVLLEAKKQLDKLDTEVRVLRAQHQQPQK